MKYLIAPVVALLLNTTNSTKTGIALSMNGDVIENSKSASIEYL